MFTGKVFNKELTRIFKGTRKKGNIIYLEEFTNDDFINFVEDIRTDIIMEQYFSKLNIKFPEFIIEDGFNKLMGKINKEEKIIKRKIIKKSVIAASIFLSVTILPLMLFESNPEAGDNNIFQRIITFRDKLLSKSEKSNINNNKLNPPPQIGDTITNTYYSFEELHKNEDVSFYELSYIPNEYELSYIEYNYSNGHIDITCGYDDNNKNVITIIQNINLSSENFNFLLTNNEFEILHVENDDIYISKNEKNILLGMFYINNDLIKIQGNISEYELIKIVEGLK